MTRLLNAAINRRVYFLLLVLLVFLPLQIFSQTSETEDEILVYFLPDSLELPDGTAELTDINKLKIKSKDLDNTFKKIELKAIKKAFPDFNINDTLKLKDDGSRIKLPNMSRIFKLKLKNRDNVQAVIDILSKEKGVLFAEPNGITAPGVIPNDQYFSYQWSLQSGGGTGKIQAPEAWDIYTGNSSNIIGIVDGGIDGTHPDLSGKVTGDAGYGWDGHGIHVAGIASAKTNNWSGTEYVGIAGIDWNAQLHAQRVDNTDDTGTYQAVVDAVNYSTNVRVLNNSWTLINTNYSPRYSTTVRFAFAYAYKMNRVAVCANGNYQESYPGQTYYPAGFGQGIIAVGATNSQDQVASFSQVNNGIDVSAPGVSVYSTYRNPDYAYLNGTSMATPHVSGMASLLKGYNSNLYNYDIEQIIRLSTDDVNSSSYPGWDQYLGTGRVNAYKAMQFLQSPYQLSQLSASGGTDYSSTDSYTIIIYGASGLADGLYVVKRHEVRKYVTFTPMYDHYVWGRGVGTNGWSLESPNFSMGFCELVPGTQTANSATLRTYVYEIWNTLGQWIGWFPTTVSNVSLNYTVLGKQLIAPVISSLVQSPSPIPPGETGIVTAVLLQGNGNITYSWSYANKPAWVSVSFSGNTAYVTNELLLLKNSGINQIMASPFSLTCTASNAAGSSTQTCYPSLSSLQKESVNNTNSQIITETKLEANYPNPFNPSTIIKYQIKEKTPVTLKRFDITGRVVRTLVDEVQESGYYEVTFDAHNLASGVYLYALSTSDYRSSNKMIFTK